ncbi:MAG: hypothetical protein JOZ69_22705 [Myxococcales bacterium]|nr:hypothetical protein [Myxococcales bacterium]
MIACWSGSGHAQVDPPPTDRDAAAQLLFEQGQALMETGQLEPACSRFAESLKLQIGIGTMLWLGDCYQSLGKTASAWAQFKEAASRAAAQSDAREGLARERAAALEATLHRLVIAVPEPVDGLTVTRDGEAIGSSEWALAVPVDPGEHSVRASAPGRRSWQVSVKVGARDAELRVDVPRLASVTVSPGAQPETTSSERPSLPAASKAGGPAQGAHRDALVIGLACAGVAALGVGSVAGVVAMDKNNQTASHCRTAAFCDPTGLALESTARSWATVADVGFGVGAAAIVGAGVVWLTSPSKRATSDSSRTVRLVPTLGGIVAVSAW